MVDFMKDKEWNIKLTKNGFSLFLIFVIFTSLGAMLRIPQAIFFSIPFVLFFVLGSIMFKNGKISVERRFDNKIAIMGGNIEYTLTVISQGFEGNVTIINRDIKESFYLKNKEKVEIKKSIKFEKFGKYDYSEIIVKFSDPSYLFKGSFTIKDSEILRIFPEMESLRKFTIRARKTRAIIGEIPSRFIGTGTDFHSIREFNYGDDKREINWKRSAFADKLMVNQFLTEKSGNTVILLDVRRYQKSDYDYKEIVENSVKAALTISNAILSSRNRLGLIVLKNTIDWIYPGYGKKQYLKIVEALLTVETKSLSFIPLEYGKKIITRFFPPNSKVIIISSLFDDSINDIVYELILKKYDLEVIVPYYESSKMETVQKILSFERRIKVRIISKYADVIEWNVDTPLTKSMEALKPWKF
ncbi:MAG: DUF58 domain-containing protein [Euryarchaeota archaeon]|jgi:uncharacterized protein (DUF58 family)|nr:DUF58 domain-containing protein [Euryarchaeota archaeon]MVT35963.1 DUF58 domain-containing protein [Euryarchaeota archaeon]